MYDIRGADGTGTSANPVAASSSNAKTYTIRKLADGNCWMTENLYLPLANNIGVEASYNNGSTFTYTPTSCSGDSECGINRNTQSSSTYGTYYYYNWFAATAGKGTSSTAANVDVDGSICPKGWKLPSNYTVNGTNPATGTAWKDMSLNSITDTYGITTTGQAGVSTTTGYQTLEASPISLLRAGDYSSGRFGHGGSGGYYWSSTASSTSNAYDLVFDSNIVYPQSSDSKARYGFSIRCLAVR